MMNLEDGCECSENFVPEKQFLQFLVAIFRDIIASVTRTNMSIYNEICNLTTITDDNYSKRFYDVLNEKLEQYSFITNLHGNLALNLNGTIELGQQVIAQYKNEIVEEEGKQIKPIRAFYRVGTTYVSISGVHEGMLQSSVTIIMHLLSSQLLV